jgi:hypothetical protein
MVTRPAAAPRHRPERSGAKAASVPGRACIRCFPAIAAVHLDPAGSLAGQAASTLPTNAPAAPHGRRTPLSEWAINPMPGRACGGPVLTHQARLAGDTPPSSAPAHRRDRPAPAASWKRAVPQPWRPAAIASPAHPEGRVRPVPASAPSPQGCGGSTFDDYSQPLAAPPRACRPLPPNVGGSLLSPPPSASPRSAPANGWCSPRPGIPGPP